ncbi:MAG: serine/threonine-protein phosphatase, partial [Spirochaetes bacterium]|nr:serine/threonine-protein phosphatase [Spirochaetota bacterium]
KVKDTAELMDILSQRLLKRLKAEKYATGIFLIYDASKGVFEYTNAGHNNLILYNKKEEKIEELEGGKGVPIGIFEDAKYETAKCKLGKGDVILLQTDGIYESMNDKREQFGLNRVKKLLEVNVGKEPGDINKSIVSEVDSFRGNKTQADDITIIAMKKK